MNSLLTEAHLIHVKSKRAIDEIVMHIGDSRPRFAQLVGLLSGRSLRCAEKASWVMIHHVEGRPDFFDPHADAVLDILAGENTSTALRRNLTRCFQEAALPEQRLGMLTDICFRQLLDPREARAVRAFSFNVLNRIVDVEEGLRSEFMICLEEISAQDCGHLRILAKKAILQHKEVSR